MRRLAAAALGLVLLPGCGDPYGGGGLFGGAGGLGGSSGYGYGGGLGSGGGYGYGGGFGGSSGGGGGAFTPPALTGLAGAPPAINTPGGSGPRSPTSLLPAPQAGSATAQKIFAAYKIPIYGAGASPAVLDVVADGLRHYRPENLAGLDRIVIQSRQGGSLDGQWSTDGQLTQVELIAHQGRQEPVTLHTVTHEFGHHWSLFTDEQGARAFDQALGDSAAAYVSEYAYNQWEDKLAEAVAYMLIGYDKAEQPPLAAWNPPQQAFAVLERQIVQGRPTF